MRATRSKVLLTSAVLAVSGLVTAPSIVKAHSGGLDSYGGHHCWTSCGSHGMVYGEYRCHRATDACRASNRRHHAHGHR